MLAIARVLPLLHCLLVYSLSSCILGIFIYPLEENSIVVGFEAMISSQIITLQVKSKAKIEDCYLDGCNSTNGALQSGSGKTEAALIYIVFRENDELLHVHKKKCFCYETTNKDHLIVKSFCSQYLLSITQQGLKGV